VKKFKSYDEMTPEERDARNRAAFNWGTVDIEFLDAETGQWVKAREHQRRQQERSHSRRRTKVSSFPLVVG
jgi:hypothetical protein